MPQHTKKSAHKHAVKHTHLIGAGLLAAAMSPVWAETSAGSAQIGSIEVVGERQSQRGSYQPAKTTIGKRNLDPQALPQSVTIINQQLLRDQAATNLKGALKNAGITFQAGEGGQTEVPIVRGMHAGGDIYDDGMRGALAQFNGDTFNTESIEVLKGSSAVLFGRGASGGIINQVSKTPFIGEQVHADIGFGNRGFKRITTDINHAFNDNIAFRFNAMSERRDSFRKGVEGEKWGFAPSITFGLGGDTQLELGHKYEAENNVPDFGVPYESTGVGKATASKSSYNQFFGYNTDFEKIRTNMTTAKVRHQFNDTTKLTNTLRYNKGEYDMLGVAPRLKGDQISRGTKATRYESSTWINQTDFNTQLKTGNVGHDLLATLELSQEKRDNYSSQYNFFNADGSAAVINPYQLGVNYGAPKENLNYTRDSKVSSVLKTRTVGLGINDIIELNPQWKVLAGVRYDHIKTSSDPTEGARVSRSDNIWNYNIGTIYEPVLGHNVYLTYNTASMPVAYRVTGQSSTLDDTQLVSDPERTKTFELGSKNTFLGGDLTVNTALFHTKKTQQYYRSSGFINATKMYGLDAEVAGRLTEKWDVIAGVVLANGKMTARDEATQQLDGKMPEASAKVTANLWSNYRFTDRWNAGVGLRYVGKRTTQNPVESGNIEQDLPAYTVADAMLGYETPRYRAQVNVNNVFDKKHFASGHRRQAIPGERRTLVATVGVKF